MNMNAVGHVESLWRYPVKSMRGEALPEAFVSFSGILGDRLYAVHNSAAPKAFPYLTARGRNNMLLYRPFFRDRERTVLPSNLQEADALGPGVTPLYPSHDELAVDVETPTGQVFGIDDPQLLHALSDNKSPASALTIRRSDRAFTDCRPISMFSTQTVRKIEDALGLAVDKRRFRANMYVDLASGEGFAEDQYVGRQLRIGSKVVIAVLERDIRCQMISLDPETSQANPEILKYVARNHDGKAGIYAAVLVEGMVREGDEIRLVE
jgi:uncharacterized protein YcbX